MVASSPSSQEPCPSTRCPSGRSFDSPIISLAAERNPSAEHLIVVDLSRGYIRTTASEARMYAENYSYTVLDLHGHRPTWDPPLNIPHREQATAQTDAPEGAYREQFVGIWEMEDETERSNSAHLDEEIFYDEEAKCFRRRKIDVTKDAEEKGKGPCDGDKRNPDAGASGAAPDGSAA